MRHWITARCIAFIIVLSGCMLLLAGCTLFQQSPNPPIPPGTAIIRSALTAVPAGPATPLPLLPTAGPTPTDTPLPATPVATSVPPTPIATALPPTPTPTQPKASGIQGIVSDKATGKPVISATVYAYAFPPSITGTLAITAPLQVISATTRSDGSYMLQTVPDNATVTLAYPGYRAFRQSLGNQAQLDITLEPFVAKGIYMTYFAAGNKKFHDNLIALIDRTELNTVVIDLKGDRGWTVYKSDVPLASTIGSNERPMIDDWNAFITLLKQKHIYVIARIVTFKDNLLATGRPDLAIKNTRTGKPWIDNEGLGWADPFQPEVWQYDRSLAREAILRGFDEVQFDYIRFPTDGNLNVLAFSKENTAQNRVAAITGFLDSVDREVKPLGGFVSADVFGYTTFNPGDLEIGQHLEDIGRRLDYISPMVYPSTFSFGIPGTDVEGIDAVAHPYDVVNLSCKRAEERLVGLPVLVRPWLQDFDDYAYDNRKFGPTEVRTQIKAAADAGTTGWLLWSPANDYSEGALEKK